MKQSILLTLATILEQFGLGFFEYYTERSSKLSISFYCRQNKYTNRKYFRTMRPICNGWDSNEWIEYEGLIDDIITDRK